MSAVVTGVTEKLQDLLPGRIGTNRTWNATSLERLIMLADRAVRERTENLDGYQEIALVQSTAAYDLDSEFVDVTAVEFSADGTNYEYYLQPATLDDLDRLNAGWRDDEGTRPEWYVLVGCPGTPGAQIHVHRPMSAVDSQTIKVIGHRIGATTATVPDDVQRKCHVPYIMSMMMAKIAPREAVDWYNKFLAGCDDVAPRTKGRYAHQPVNVRLGWR